MSSVEGKKEKTATENGKFYKAYLLEYVKGGG